VNHFKPSSPSEEDLFTRRDALAKSRKAAKAAAQRSAHVVEGVSGTTVGGISVDTLNALVERGQAMEDMPSLAHPNAVLMKRTVLENCLLCRPQHANTAGRVFGGFMSTFHHHSSSVSRISSHPS
jgi:acyl-coenzyme A thioesterase 9